MADQDPNGPDRPPPTSLPPQPNQLLDRSYAFTPYYTTSEDARRFRGRATPYLSNNLKHPPEKFPEPRNLLPGSDPIMDARKEGGERSGEWSYKQVQAFKDMRVMSHAERHERDVKEFPSSPPDALTKAQQQRWVKLFAELLGEEKIKEDPLSIRARAELRKLKKLAELAGGKHE